MDSIFTFITVRDYLQAWWQAEGNELGFRRAALLLNARTPSYFHKIINGEKSVTPHKLELFIRLLNLDAAEARYFIVLASVGRPRVPITIRESILDRFRPAKYKATKTTTENEK